MKTHHALLLFTIAASAPAADIGWAGAPGDQAPAGWTVALGRPASVKTIVPSVRFLDGMLEITGNAAVAALAATAIDLPDASDVQPLRLSAQVAASGERALETAPAIIALQWATGAVFAVGLGDNPRWHREERRAWALWAGAGKSGTARADGELAEGAVPAHLRIVVTARELVAYGSSDGWYWNRVASVTRAGIGAAGPPTRVLLGRARIAADGLGLAPLAEGYARNGVWRFAQMRIENDAATLPAALTKNYVRQESYADTCEALNRAGRPTTWRLRTSGAGSKGFPPTLLGDEATRGEGSEYTLAPNERFLQPGRLLSGGNEGVRWAATTLHLDAAGWIRLLFDGTRRAWVWVDGRLVGGGEREHDEARLDRQSALTRLGAGDHQVVLGLRGGSERMSATLRWEDGDPRHHIAILRRLALDFPDEPELAAAPFEIARLWEGLGFAREAVTALTETAARSEGGDEVQAALAERARLLRNLGDEAGAADEIARLNRLWAADGGSDRLAMAVRTARLWQRLDVPERAQAALGEALGLPDLSGPARAGLALERSRLALRRNDPVATAADLRAAAGFLPEGDARRFLLAANAARVDSQAGGEVGATLTALAAQAASAAQLRRVTGILAARKDEAGRCAVLTAASRGAPGDLDWPAIEAAELQAAKNPSVAEGIYHAELERNGITADGASLPRLRLALARATIAATPAGAHLLADADGTRAASDGVLRWQVAGPWPLDNWKLVEQPPFDVALGDGAAAAGKPWREVPAAAVQGDVIDLIACGMGDDAVMFLRTVIESDGDRPLPATAGADDALAVWVNGRPLYADRDQRIMEPDAISLILPLRKGRNVVVCAVQNGSNLSAFQMRLHRDSWPAGDVAAALAALGGEERTSAGIRLVTLCTQLRRVGRSAEAAALARAVIRLWPDDPDRQQRVASPVLWEKAWNDEPVLVQELAVWYDGLLADRARDDANLAAQVAELMPQRLVETGAGAEAVEALRRCATTDLDPAVAAQAALRESDLWRRMGFARQAAAAAGRAVGAATTAGDESLAAEAARRQRTTAAISNDAVTVTTPFETGNTLRTAARAAAAGEAERAIDDWGRIIESGHDQALRIDGGALVGVAIHASAALRRAGDAVLGAWRGRCDSRAGAALARAVADGDALACERLAARWPAATPAAEALLQAADLWAARGAWSLAQGAAQRALAEDPPADRLRALTLLAWSAARSGDDHARDEALAALTALGRPLRWDGRDLDVEAFAAALRALRPPPAAITPTARVLSVRLPVDAQAVVQTARVDGAHRSAAGAITGDLLVAATTRCLMAVDRTSGALRWRIDDDHLPAAPAPGSGDAIPEAAVAVWDGMVVARLQRDGAMRLVAVDAASGRLRWTSDACPGLADAAAMSAPRLAGGLVWAWFAARGRSCVACLDARDGRVVWTSTLGTGPAPQPLKEIEMTCTGHAAAPLLVGGDLVVSTDAGLVGCFTAATGTLRWLQAYPRTCPDPQDGAMALERLAARGAGRIVADAQHIYCAPRDTLAVLALERSTGAIAWSADLEDARELVGLGSAGVIIAGDGVGCLAAADGVRRWRWRPPRGRVLGRPALAGDTIWTATADGLTALAAASGAASAGPTWSGLQLADGEAPAALDASSHGLIACGDGLVALLAATGSGAQLDAAVGRQAAIATGVHGSEADATITTLAAAWELPVGRITDLMRPADAQGGECYALAGGNVLRLDATTGATLWSVPAPVDVDHGMQVAGDAVLVSCGTMAAVYGRADGRLRWCAAAGGSLGRAVNQRWNPSLMALDAGAVSTFQPREPQWSVRDAQDGRLLGSGRAEGGVLALRVRGELVDAVVTRQNHLWVETSAIAAGTRSTATDLGIAGNDRVSLLRLPDGSLLIAGSRDTVRWIPGAAPQTLGSAQGELLSVWEDGGRYVIASASERHRFTSTILDPATGRLLASTMVTDGWRTHWWEANGHFERLVGGMRLRGAERSNRAGVVGIRPDGSEAFWLPSGERWRRRPVAMLPLAGHGLYLTHDRDGRTFGTLVDTAGNATVPETVLPGTLPWPSPPPLACHGVAVYGTVRGLVGLVATGAPPAADGGAAGISWARAALQEPLTVPRAPVPLVDGCADDWSSIPVCEVPAAVRRNGTSGAAISGPLRIRATWGDDGLRLLGELPIPCAAIERCLLAVDLVEHEAKSGDPVLLLSLDWDAGRPTARVLMAGLGEDAARPRIQAAASAAAGTTWEVLVPWGWLWSQQEGRRPGREQQLRAGCAAWMRDALGRSAVIEWGDGLVQGTDRSGLVRLRLEERKR